MILSASFRRRIAVSVAAALCGALLYEATLLDSRYAARHARFRAMTAPPAPGETLRFQATAYCKGTITKSGVPVRSGIAAGDPQLLPVGSVIAVGAAGSYNGIYTILDTGPAIQGRIIDLYMWSCYEALEFGRRDIDCAWGGGPSIARRIASTSCSGSVKTSGVRPSSPPGRSDRPPLCFPVERVSLPTAVAHGSCSESDIR